MCGKFWEMLEIVANTRYYLKTGIQRNCTYVKNMHVLVGEKDYEIREGDLGGWIEYLQEQEITEAVFCAALEDLWNEEEKQVHPDWEIRLLNEEKKKEIVLDDYMRHIDFREGWYRALREKGERALAEEYCYAEAEKEFWEEIQKNMEYAKLRELKLSAEKFNDTLRILSGNYTREEIDNRRETPFILPPSYSEKAQRMMDALRESQLFHGMGNWGDGTAPDGMIKDLYKQYMRAALWAINEGDK
mgnify:CR=1 FL=1